MRVLILGNTRPDSSEDSIARALGTRHEVSMFDYEARQNPFGHGRLRRLNLGFRLSLQAFKQSPTVLSDRELLSWARGRRFDLVMVLTIDLVPGPVIAELRRMTGALMIGWFPDAIVNLDRGHFFDAPYDRVFLKDKVVVARFRTGLKSDRYEHLPQAFDPDLHRPVTPGAPAVDVATFGNSYRYRVALMAKLFQTPEISTVIYGMPSSGADRLVAAAYRPPVIGLAKSAAMRAARVALNTNHFGELGGVNKRTFELAGMGAFQLTDGPSVADYFVPGEEVATFQGPDELLERVRWYLERPDERARIAGAGLRRAWREHTYAHRMNALFDRVPELRDAERLPVPREPPPSS